MNKDNITNKISDIKRFSEDKKANNAEATGNKTLMSKTMGATLNEHDFAKTSTDPKSGKSKASSPVRRTPQLTGNLERPPSRQEITYLEYDLDERVQLVLQNYEEVKTEAESFGEYTTFQPKKENMIMLRNKMLSEFNGNGQTSANAIQNEPWLDNYIKSECLKTMCEEVASKLSDMLSISSIELGNVMRKLKLTYKESFDRANESWRQLRLSYLEDKKLVNHNMVTIKRLQSDIANKEVELNRRFETDLARITKQFQDEKERDAEQLKQTEFKMDQMGETLKYLNGLFKTMQGDTSTHKSGDIASKCLRLERENAELLEQNATFETTKVALVNAEKRMKTAENNNKMLEEEVARLKKDLIRRDEAITSLMERDALRNAEIEKLQRITKAKDDELINLDLKDPATSVLCVKCRKGLDDLSNIRAAILGDGQIKASKLVCEEFRILLPNIKGRRPNRSNLWLRNCMRSIFLSKMKEDVCLQSLKGDIAYFPSFVYAWFHRETSGLTGNLLTKLLQSCDEDRWGFYYGVKALAKDDPEAMIFWSLLDQQFGNDGMQYILYCMSVILTIGGVKLWKQFGPCFSQGASINTKAADDSSIQPVIWLDINLAKEGVKFILTRALSVHVADAMDAIEALKVRPSQKDLEALHEIDFELALEAGETPPPPPASSASVAPSVAQSAAPSAAQGSAAGGAEVTPELPVEEQPAPAAAPVKEFNEEATHINLFMWLRLMMQQMHADQIHRAAAVRLMFETASIGALTPQNNADNSNVGSNAYGATGSHVEYPQFQSICNTLFPFLAMTDVASLYNLCYETSNHRVNAEIFTKQANLKGYFTFALKFPLMPLLTPYKMGERDPTTDATNGSLAIETTPKKIGTGCSPHTEIILRSKLATIVHRKMAVIKPAIKNLITSLPEKYKVMLTDALTAVTASLQDTHIKLRMREQELSIQRNTVPTGKIEGQKDYPYIDGLQPFIYYRRLLALAALIKGMTDNPIRPEELFNLDVLDNNNHVIDQSISKAESILTGLEHNLLVKEVKSSASPTTLSQRKNSTMGGFEFVRKILITRRVQNVIKKFVTKEVPVPRTIRFQMACGYLRELQKGKKSKYLIKNREVFYEPWYGQATISEIYRYKYMYDLKAVSMGLDCIPLSQAVACYHYSLLGSMEMADRAIHDLFNGIKAYRLGVPRMRLFAAFLGDGRDLDDNVTEILRTPHAFNVYMTLLMEIHKEVNAAKKAFYTRLQASKPGDKQAQDLAKMGITKVPEANDSLLPDSVATPPPESADAGPHSYDFEDDPSKIEVFFPSSENTTTRIDKRDVWYVPVRLVNRVLKRWSTPQKLLYGSTAVYTDLIDKLKTNMWGEVEVDDVLYITLIQWAKLASVIVKKSKSRSEVVEVNHLDALYQEEVVDEKKQETAPPPPGTLVKNKSIKFKPDTIAFLKLLPVLPLSSLKSIVESVYRPGEGPEYSDSQYFSVNYLHRFGIQHSNRCVSNRPETLMGTATKFSAEMERLLKDCVLWDLVNIVGPNAGLKKGAAPVLVDAAPSDHKTPSHRKTPTAAVKAKTPKNTAEPLGHITPYMFCQYRFLMSVNPELSLTYAKKIFSSYQTPANLLIAKVTENERYNDDAEVQRKLQALRVLLLSLAEIFQGELIAEYKTFKLYVYEVLGIDRFAAEDPESNDIIDEFNQQEFVTMSKINTLRAHREHVLEVSQQAWSMIQSLMSMLAELTICISEDFPRDSWSVGIKIHVDRAFVYNVHTKNSLTN